MNGGQRRRGLLHMERLPLAPVTTHRRLAAGMTSDESCAVNSPPGGPANLFLCRSVQL